MWALSLGGEDLLEEEMQPNPVFLPGKSQGQRSLASYIVHSVLKSQIQLSACTHTHNTRIKGLAELPPTTV